MLRPEVRHILGVRRPSNFKLGTPRSRGPSDRCWPVSRERKVSETAWLVGWLWLLVIRLCQRLITKLLQVLKNIN